MFWKAKNQGDNIKCFLLACLVLFYVCLKLNVEVFIVSVHGLEFKRSECTSYYNIACQIQKDPH